MEDTGHSFDLKTLTYRQMTFFNKQNEGRIAITESCPFNWCSANYSLVAIAIAGAGTAIPTLRTANF